MESNTGYLRGGATVPTFAWPTYPIDVQKLMGAHHAGVNADIQYSLGAKPGAQQAIATIGKSDCSGWVAKLIYEATSGKINLCGMGTDTLAERFRKAGLKVSTVDAGTYEDGAVRVAVMLRDVTKGILVGHTAIIFDGVTLECYGGHGVGSRAWTGDGWQRKATIWVLSPPTK